MYNFNEILLTKLEEIIFILEKGQFANQTPINKKQNKKNNKKRGNEMQRGSITYRSDGRWMGRCYDENRKQKCVYAQTKKECSEKLRILIDSVEKKKKNPNANSAYISILEYFDWWFKKYKEPVIKESTAIQNKRLISRCLRPIGDLQIKDITLQKLQDIINNIDSIGERKVAYSYLNQLYEQLFFTNVVPQNLMKLVVVADSRKNIIREMPNDDEDKKILEIGDEDKIIYKKDEIGYKHFVEFAINTGMRPGEILGLQKKDLDFSKNRIFVTKQLNATTGKISTPKSKKGNRVIPMFDKTKEILLEMGVDKLQDESFIFLLAHRNIQNFMKRVTDNQHIPISSKMLRKTFSSRCQNVYGISQKQVQIWLGHESSETTDKHYTFISNEETLCNIEKYNELTHTQTHIANI